MPSTISGSASPALGCLRVQDAQPSGGLDALHHAAPAHALDGRDADVRDIRDLRSRSEPPSRSSSASRRMCAWRCLRVAVRFPGR